MKSLTRMFLAMLILMLLSTPALSLAESDYEEGDGWAYRDGELKIVTNNGLINFLYHEFDMIGDPQYQHTAADADRVVIGKDVTDIIVDYFIGDYNPSITSVEEGNESFIIDNGWVVNKKTNTLFGAANVKQNKTRSVIEDLPTYIEYIGMYAFSDCRALKRIVIPDRVVSIGEFSFSGCDSLESITLPSNTSSIGDGAFSDCSKMTHINFESRINKIGIMAFDACINLEPPSIYNTRIEIVHSNSFWGCGKFQTVEFPSSVSLVEDQSFGHCKTLGTLIFNSDRLIIEDSAFDSCENIRTLVFTKGKPTSIGNSLFGETEKTSDGKGFIVHYYEKSDKIIPYPTLYYTAAYASEWAPNGETEWNGYPIQQISQEELEAILAEARGEELSETSISPEPTVAQQAETPIPGESDAEAAPATCVEGIMLAVIGIAAIAVAAVLAVRLKKEKR